MGLRDLVKKKDRLGEGGAGYSETLDRLSGPEFTLIRSDTNTHEIIYPPTHPAADHGRDPERDRHLSAREAGPAPSKARRSLDVFRPRSRGNSLLSASGDSNDDSPSKDHRRLSQRLGLSRHSSHSSNRKSKTSEYVPEDLPQDLPQINITTTNDPATAETSEAKDAREQQWEKRATILASTNEARQRSRSVSASVSPSSSHATLAGLGSAVDGPETKRVVSSKETDQDIQEAIRLHEEGDLEQSTLLFGRLADPYGANNPLSQVLYGLALRHGWGCEVDAERAVTYLSAAASNAAGVETMALKAGVKKGGAAKGELVLAIFELANCFRHGWGIAKDPIAAKQYYETAANLGDTDAMNEAAWCYLEGYGCKKDKFQAARYYRLAEKSGSKTLGNTW
ncbi:HCP-like protein [Astrocystis sublimbata]|nr:HCP-like protein [Astrocystis sublimbata]